MLPLNNADPEFIFVRIIESSPPPAGWTASFFYCNESGLIQSGVEIGENLFFHEWHSGTLWEEISALIPQDDISSNVVPQSIPIGGVDMQADSTLQVWAGIPGGIPRGWVGEKSSGSAALSNLCERIETLTSHAPPPEMEAGNVEPERFVRCELLDQTTVSAFKRADLMVPLKKELMSQYIKQAAMQPFRAVAVPRDQNPFMPWRSSVAWGRTAVEGWVQSVPVQMRSWMGRSKTSPGRTGEK